jgi:hypothetical protein
LTFAVTAALALVVWIFWVRPRSYAADTIGKGNSGIGGADRAGTGPVG